MVIKASHTEPYIPCDSKQTWHWLSDFLCSRDMWSESNVVHLAISRELLKQWRNSQGILW